MLQEWKAEEDSVLPSFDERDSTLYKCENQQYGTGKHNKALAYWLLFVLPLITKGAAVMRNVAEQYAIVFQCETILSLFILSWG